jgi:hypothetical protein
MGPEGSRSCPQETATGSYGPTWIQSTPPNLIQRFPKYGTRPVGWVAQDFIGKLQSKTESIIIPWTSGIVCLLSCITSGTHPLQLQDRSVQFQASFSHCISCTVWSPTSQTEAVRYWQLATLSLAFRVVLSARRVSTIDIPRHCTYICNPPFAPRSTIALLQ